MKRLRRLLASLLTMIMILSPVCGCAAEGLLRVPAGIRTIESEAFADADVSGGVFIPASCTDIAPDAFSNPEALEIYGFTGSRAESYASEVGAAFHSVDIENASVSGSVWASPDREVTFRADFTCPEKTEISFEIIKDGETIHAGEPSEAADFTYTFFEGGEYAISAEIKSPYETVLAHLPAPLKVAERIKTAAGVFYLEVGETASLLSPDETRAVSLSVPDAGLSVSGTNVTANALGKYIVTASAETEDGTVYTDIPVEVIVSAKSVDIHAESRQVLKNHSLQLTADVLPMDATYRDVTWSVDNEEIAVISEDGLLTGLETGVVTVYAASGDVMASVEILVEKPVEAFEFTSPDQPETLLTGMHFTLTAHARPEDAGNPTCSFVSLTPEICSVDAFTGVVTCLQAGEGRIRANANDPGGASGEYVFQILPGVTEIAFVSVPDALSPSETFLLEYTCLPEDAQGASVVFTSSDESVLTVSEDGLLTAVAPGSVTVTAATLNGLTASFTIQVLTPVTDVISALDTLLLNPGMTADPIGNFVFVQPENASDKSLVWLSDNRLVAEVDKNTGLITAQSDGICRIQGTSHSGKTVSFTVRVVSDARVVQRIALSSTYGALNVGNTAVLTPAALPSNKYTSGTWYSDHPEILDIVSVDKANKATIKALSPGQATIYAISSSGISASCTVVVNPIVVKEVFLNAASVSLNVGDTFPLGATFNPENATEATLHWTSSNEDVATVNANGMIRALKGGLSVITAQTEDGISASCRVTVKTIPMTDVFVNETEIFALAGESGYAAYTVTPENATPANFFWRSDNRNVVSVHSATGEMQYLSEGTAVISATALDGSGLSLEVTVHVRENPVTSLEANAESIVLLPGETFSLFTRVLPLNASYGDPVFESEDPAIASVGEDGVVTAVSKGKTIIQISAGHGEYLHTLKIPVIVEAVNDVTYRALIMGQFTVPASEGYLPFSNNSTKGFADAISRSSIDGNRYEVTRIAGSPSPGAIRSAISRLADQADENDVTVVFFLTHGTNEGSEGYVMQTNSGIVIESAGMINALKEISGHVVFVLCTCHSGRILSTSGAQALKSAGGSYEGRNGKGHLSILCSSTSTNSSYYRINDEKLSFDFYTDAVTRGLGWNMLSDSVTPSLLADANGDGKVTVSELAAYSRGATQRGISSFVQRYGKTGFSGHAAQFPTWQIAAGDEDLVIFEK